MPVTSDQLPLSLSKAMDKQPNASELPFALRQKLGLKLGEVTASALPLPLSRLLSDQPHASDLPFKLSQPSGILVDDGYIDHTPIEPPPELIEPAEPRRMLGVIGICDIRYDSAVNVADCLAFAISSQNIANQIDFTRTLVHLINNCTYFATQGLINIASDIDTKMRQGVLVSRCAQINVSAFVLLTSCKSIKTSSGINYGNCTRVYSAKSVLHRKCVTIFQQPVINYSSTVVYQQSSKLISRQQTIRTQRSVPVPCRYYPIPEPPPEKPKFSCKIRPPADRLPLNMTRKRGRIPSSALPLNFVCWHDELSNVIPNLKAYIMHNTITATVGGVDIAPLSFNIHTDIASYCWQGSIDITAKDYARIKHKLDVARGNEPLINVTINGHIFTIMAEEQQRNRQFANHTHTLSGRSLTARLGTDYALPINGLVEQSSYASQLVNQVINNLPVKIEGWGIADWLIPGDIYALSGKTAIAVISDIADVASGFVTSDTSQPVLSLKPRWPVAAWDIATAKPDVIIPIDVILSTSDSKRSDVRYNTVTLTGVSDGGHIYRQLQARDKLAPVLQHALFTSQDVMIPKGIATLSDSGTHSDNTIKIRWSDKYDIALAKLGQIWQINDIDGSWRGVINSVSVSVSIQDDVPQVTQTININRYMDV